jgi:hypothetical protein
LTLTSTGQLAPCGPATAATIVTINPVLTVSAGSNQTVCANHPTVIGGSPTTASGGTGPYTYSWSPVTGLDNPAAANPTATVSNRTTYTVMVTDARGCTGGASVVLTLASPLSHRFYRVARVQAERLTQPAVIPSIVIPGAILITSIHVSGTNVPIVWTSVPTYVYRLQYNNNLTDAGWTDVPGDVTASGPTATKTDIIPVGGCP